MEMGASTTCLLVLSTLVAASTQLPTCMKGSQGLCVQPLCMWNAENQIGGAGSHGCDSSSYCCLRAGGRSTCTDMRNSGRHAVCLEPERCEAYEGYVIRDASGVMCAGAGGGRTVCCVKEDASATNLNKLVRKCLSKAKTVVTGAIEKTNTAKPGKGPRRKATPHGRLRAFRSPDDDVKALSRAAEIYYFTLECVKEATGTSDRDFRKFVKENISSKLLRHLAGQAGCIPIPPPSSCDARSPYRTITGECNNLARPLWGRSVTQFTRCLPAYYKDKIQKPFGKEYPSPRYVSQQMIDLLQNPNTCTPVSVLDDPNYTLMLMQWGQFLDHDLDFTPVVESDVDYTSGAECSQACNNSPPCFSIDIPGKDCRLNTKCMGFVRSASICQTEVPPFEPRQQVNQITAYIDASNVYGSSQKTLDLCRNPVDRRLLKVGDGNMLPSDDTGAVECPLEEGVNTTCFKAGDRRVNEQVALTAMHTVWMREHNRVALKLSRMNSHWDAERVFQESRKTVYAEMEHITYNEWLPKILGPSGMSELGPYNGYDPNVDASIFNEFATAAFRFGHTLIQPEFLRLDDNYQPIPEGHLPLHKGFFAPQQLRDFGIDVYLRGLLVYAAKMRDSHLNRDLTERLFELNGEIALDLAALNIQRNRDHGLRGYNAYRRMCPDTEYAATFDDLTEIVPEVRNALANVYASPDDIDLWVGLIAETNLPNSRVGPTLQCLFVKQFKATRDGDRFWYENPGVFTIDQLNELKKASLSRVLCDNSGIETIQEDAFVTTNRRVSCKDLPKVALSRWKESGP